MANGNTLVLTDSQQAQLAIAEVDKKGNPVDPGAAGFSTPTWTSSDESVITVTPSVDGATAAVVAAGKTGTAQVGVTVQGGDQLLTGTLMVTVVPGAAAAISITPGTPTEQ